MEGKKIKGRKRHIVTDTEGHLLHVKVHAANTHDTVAGCSVFKEALKNTQVFKVSVQMLVIERPWTNL